MSDIPVQKEILDDFVQNIVQNIFHFQYIIF